MRVLTFALVLLLGSSPLVAQADASVDNAWVTQAYQMLLSRTPSSAEAAGWAQFTRPQVVSTIISSPEYRTREVAALYQALLHRAADSGAASVFANLLVNGSPLSLDPDTQVAATLTGSQEYFTRNGSANPSFVSAVYHDLLHRTPSPPEVSAQLQVLAQLNATSATPDAARRAFAAYVLGSPEGKQYLIGLLLPAVSPPSGANLVAAACTKLQCSGGATITSQTLGTLPSSVQLPPSGRARSATLSIGDFKFTIQQIDSHASPTAPKVTLTAPYDKASAQFLMKSSLAGEHIGSAKLTTAAGTYTMHEVLVTGVTISGNKPESTETFTLNFTKIEWTK